MTTTNESIMADLDTTTTDAVEDLFTTNMENSITEETTMDPPPTSSVITTTTNVASTSNPAKVQGELTDITTRNLIKLPIPYATSTTVGELIKMKQSEIKENAKTVSTVDYTTVLEMTTPIVTTEKSEATDTTDITSTPETLSTITTEKSSTTTTTSTTDTTESLKVTTPYAEILTTIDTLETFKALNKQVSNKLTSTEATTAAKTMESYKEINNAIKNEISSTVDTMAAYEFMSTVEKTTTLGTTTIRPIAYELTTLPSTPRTTTSKARMLTTVEVRTTNFPTTYAGTEAPDLIMSNNIEEMFGTNMQPKSTNGTDVNVIIAIVVSIVGVTALLLLIGFLYLIRRRQKQTKQSQRCHPATSDAYSLDNISVFGSFRRKSVYGRASKRTYSNAAFDDPTLCHNVLNVNELAKFVGQRSHIFTEFRNIPDITAKITEVPHGCEDKNRFEF